MAVLTQRKIWAQNRAAGLGYGMPIVFGGVNGTTGSNFNNSINIDIWANNIGSTFPNSPQTLPAPAGLSAQLFAQYIHCCANQVRSGWLALVYKLGTLDLSNAAATPYNGFTHNANFTGPINRTIHGQASQPIPLMPLIYYTTTAGSTAPTFILKSIAGGTGYVNQAGANVVGTKANVSDGVGVGVGSICTIRLEDGDSGVQDVVQIDVSASKDNTCKASIYGAELLLPVANVANCGGVFDGMFSSLMLQDINPGVPTSGSLSVGSDVLLAFIAGFSGTFSNAPTMWFTAVLNQ